LLAPGQPARAAADCRADCDSAYQLCMRGPGVDVRACSTGQSICLMGCRASFQAIAYSPKAGNLGYAYDMPSQDRAEAQALENCRAQAGTDAGDCRIVTWSRDACAALATSPDGRFGGSWGDDRTSAERAALGLCREQGGTGCTLARTVCAGG
jgi:hypothetical protein